MRRRVDDGTDQRRPRTIGVRQVYPATAIGQWRLRYNGETLEDGVEHTTKQALIEGFCHASKLTQSEQALAGRRILPTIG